MKLVSIWHGAVFAEYQKRYRELARLGYDVTLIAPERWSAGLPAPATLERLPEAEFELIGLPTHWARHGATFYYSGLSRTLARLQPDVIECIEEPYSLAAFLVARWRRRYAPHAKLIVSTCQNIRKNYPPPFGWMERYVLRQADALTGLNAESIEIYRAKGFDKPAIVLPTGLDLAAFPLRDDPERWNDPPIVGYAGRMVDEKGLDTLLRAAQAAKTPCRVMLAGQGPDRARLKALARTLDIENRVEFLDAIPHGQMAEFYRALDMFALPSLTRPNWKEQFGRVLVEAMACGANVIGSDSGEIPRVIGDAGLIFAEGDAQALAAKIDQLAQDANLRNELRRRGREKVEREYTWQAVAQTLHGFIQSLVATQGSYP
ncbi:glycosyltransferase [Candidatus Sumerlaeota bacterium]|nr:glycosyltransferase [Candidatus Sumerlaeota bacterium]